MDTASNASLGYQMAVGDVISVKGPSVPDGWDAHFFRIIGFQDDWQTINLDGPYLDRDCTVKAVDAD
jgi:hypothetical protein